jgi:hypothetical protein
MPNPIPQHLSTGRYYSLPPKSENLIALLVALHVAGWEHVPSASAEAGHAPELVRSPAGELFSASQLPFARSLDSLLPFLEAAGWRCTSKRSGGTCGAYVEVMLPPGRLDVNSLRPEIGASANDAGAENPLATAACLALLRSRGISIYYKSPYNQR